ncbi:FecR family protein [Bordetella genomosp. 13]|uniref:FecR family protein n=1 Tax=Bordetella genomosp. 13 TaxID=463040 RepID=UPI0011A79DA6|nr:DUF4880 domain-containing protein [Bordetella genomosp. 13]
MVDPRLSAQARAWAVKLKTGRPSVRDLAALRAWCAQSPAHAQAWSRAAHDWRQVEDAARRHAATQPAPRPERFRQRRRLFLAGAVSGAGALAVAGIVRPPLGLWPSWQDLGADYRTAPGEQRTVMLAQAVRVMLNTRTSITVHDDAAAARIEVLSGEAAVSAPRAGCTVAAGMGRVVMDHADLEIRRLADGRVRVRCQQGSAMLHHPVRAVGLRQRQEVVYDDRQVGLPTPLGPAASDWQQGVVVFDDLPLGEVVQEINRYRAGRVVLVDTALASRRFSARVKVADLDEALRLLEARYHVPVRRMGQLVLVG